MDGTGPEIHTSPFSKLRKGLLGWGSVGFPQMLQLLKLINISLLIVTPQSASCIFESAQHRCEGRAVAEQRRKGPSYTECQSSTLHKTTIYHQKEIVKRTAKT